MTCIQGSAFLLCCQAHLEGEIEISEVAKALWNAPFVVLAHDK